MILQYYEIENGGDIPGWKKAREVVEENKVKRMSNWVHMCMWGIRKRVTWNLEIKCDRENIPNKRAVYIIVGEVIRLGL